jgi:hypothetical protein
MRAAVNEKQVRPSQVQESNDPCALLEDVERPKLNSKATLCTRTRDDTSDGRSTPEKEQRIEAGGLLGSSKGRHY